jgi:hypothetical protein
MNTRDFQYMRGRQGSVTLASTYTAQADIVAFLNSGANGELAVVNKATGVIYDGTTVVPAGTEVYLSVKRDGANFSSASFIFQGTNTSANTSSAVLVTKVIGVAASVQVVQVIISCGFNANCGNCINCVADPLEDYRIGIIEQRSQDFVPDELTYFQPANGTDTIQSVVAALVAQINDVSGATPTNRNGRQRVTASTPVVANAGSTTVTTTVTFNITGLTERPFKVALGGFCYVVKNITTPALDAINGYADVRQYEKEGAVYDGDRYQQRAFPPLVEIDGSHPTKLASSGTLYTLFQFEVNKSFTSLTYKERDFQPSEQAIYVPNGGTLATKLATLFAV